MRLEGRNGSGMAIAVIERPDLSFIDLIFWLVVLVFGLKTGVVGVEQRRRW
jgi:hypothetical protein